MQYVAVRARGASKPFLSCIVSDLKRTLRASTGLQRILYDINLAVDCQMDPFQFSRCLARARPGSENGDLQKTNLVVRGFKAFVGPRVVGGRHASVLREGSVRSRLSPLSLSNSDFPSLSLTLFPLSHLFHLSLHSVFLPPLALSFPSLSLSPLSLSRCRTSLSLSLRLSLSLSPLSAGRLMT